MYIYIYLLLYIYTTNLKMHNIYILISIFINSHSTTDI